MELANWIYYEDENFYCFEHLKERLNQINNNKEFSEYIDYENGDECGYMQDYADTEQNYQAECFKCGKMLFTKGFN